MFLFQQRVRYGAFMFSRVQLFVTPWTIARQTALSMGLSWQEYWTGLPFPSQGDLPDPEIELMSSALVGSFFTTEPVGKLSHFTLLILKIHFHKFCVTRRQFLYSWFKVLVVPNLFFGHIVALRILVPWPGIQPLSLQWKCGVLTPEDSKKILRRGGKNTRKNCTKKIFTTQIIMMIWSLI